VAGFFTCGGSLRIEEHSEKKCDREPVSEHGEMMNVGVDNVPYGSEEGGCLLPFCICRGPWLLFSKKSCSLMVDMIHIFVCDIGEIEG